MKCEVFSHLLSIINYQLSMAETEKLKEELLQTKLAYLSALQMSQFKGEYLGKIAHELRAPLSSMISLHQLIISDLCDNPKEEREFTIKAYEYAQKLIGLIDEVVTISQIESGKIKPEIKSIQVTEILTKINNLTYLQIANRNLKLIISETEPNLYVVADEKNLIQSLVNLIDVSLNKIETGNIIIDVQNLSFQNLIAINLDFPLPLSIWNQPQTTDLTFSIPEDAKNINKLPQFSPSMRVNLSQQLIENMGGIFNILELTPDTKLITRLQFLFPNAFPMTPIPQSDLA